MTERPEDPKDVGESPEERIEESPESGDAHDETEATGHGKELAGDAAGLPPGSTPRSPLVAWAMAQGVIAWAVLLGVIFTVTIAALNATGSNVKSMLQRVDNTIDTVS